jgi:hypothetical protein
MDERRGPGRCKCKFAPCEDLRLAEVVCRHGCKSWAFIARQMPGRNPRQCRERWMNYINPILKHSPLTPEEERILEEKFGEYGTRWKVIASFFPGRGRNFLKNHWMSKHKRLQEQLTAKSDSEGLQGDHSVAVPQPPSGEPPFDLFFPDAERHDIFWERVAAEYF